MKVYIYGLKDPETKQIRYIGKANDPKARYSQHIACRDTNGHKQNWIKGLLSKGLKPELTILEVTDDKHWEEKEKAWIKLGRDIGWPLTNVAEGGMCRPDPVYATRNWVSIMRGYMPTDEAERFANLPEDKQFEICQRTALAMLEHSWTAIKQRGGFPQILYDKDAQYWVGSDKARELLKANV